MSSRRRSAESKLFRPSPERKREDQIVGPTALLGSKNAHAIPSNPLRALAPLLARPGMVSFANGRPSPDACDMQGLADASAVASQEAASWQYGPTQGDLELRERLARLSGAETGDIIMVSGAQQGIDVAVRATLDEGNDIGVPAALYPAALSVFAACGVRPVPIQEDDGGMTVEGVATALSSGVKALYLTPTFANPTGRTMPVDRRLALLDVCRAARAVIIEDDPYQELWFHEMPPPSFWELAHRSSATNDTCSVIVLRSASKTIAPGLRIGWMMVDRPLRALCLAIKQACDLQVSSFLQRVLVHYLKSQRLPEWLSAVRKLYLARHDALVEGLAGHGLPATPAVGGMFLWVAMPQDVSADALFRAASECGVVYAPGSRFLAVPNSSTDLDGFARFSFVAANQSQISMGCHRFGKALAQLRQVS